ncbi:MAG: protein kinase [Nevskia sp.]|nr:protein kinase [Nevskia sp.]
MTVALMLGNYELVGELGRGGMCAVYQAQDVRNGRVVALKEMLPSAFGSTDEYNLACSEFLEAAEAAKELRHPNVLKVYEAGEADGRFFVAMEVFKGNTLQDYINHHLIIPSLNMLDISIQVLQALIYAHSQRVVHRDLKPSNIAVTTAGRVKVADFGIAMAARVTEDWGKRAELLGTMDYVAPELFENFRDPRAFGADLYSIGSIMYKMFTQHAVFTADSVPELMQKITHDKPLAPRNLNPQIPPPIETVINRCLQKTANLRFRDAQETHHELFKFRPALAKVTAASEPFQITMNPAGPASARMMAGPAAAATVDMTSKKISIRFKLAVGRQGNGKSEFNSPRDVAMLGKTAIVVADYDNGRLQVFGTDGIWQAEIVPQGAKEKLAPISICCDPKGTLIYVVDSDDTKVKVYDAKTGDPKGSFGFKGSNRGAFLTPTGVATHKKGNIFICDSEAGVIHIFNPQNQFVDSLGKPGKEPGELKTPYAIGIDDDEHMTILEYSIPRVQILNRDGNSVRCFGQRGSNPGEFAVPRGLCIDKYRNVYVADTMNRRIQMFDVHGNVLTTFGFGGSGEGEFAAPEGIDINDKLELVVADKGNNRIQILQVEIA